MPPTCPRSSNTNRRQPSPAADIRAERQRQIIPAIEYHPTRDSLVMRRSGVQLQGGSKVFGLTSNLFWRFLEGQRSRGSDGLDAD